MREGYKMKAAHNRIGTMIAVYNQYTGRIVERKILNITLSANVIVVERMGWDTKEMRLNYRPSDNMYFNDYAGDVIKLAHP